MLLHFTVSDEAFAPDQMTYDWVGYELQRYWAGERNAPLICPFTTIGS